MRTEWHTRRFNIDLRQPKVMGIVNVTPDSFSDGGHYTQALQALRHCERLLAEGADILDIGGESSRPGAPSLTVEEEWSRLAPVLLGAVKLGAPVSVDTCKAEIMRRALEVGVDIINDIRALTAPEAMGVVSSVRGVGVCLMHMRGDPATMQQSTHYEDVVDEVRAFLSDRVHAVEQAGIGAEQIVLDPGIGFGKTPEQNMRLQQRQVDVLQLGYPVLVGWSRKSTLGVITGREVGERLPASLAAALAGVAAGASVVRVHDVAATVDALKVWQALR
jgi:dihydropteroate synthase